MNKLIKKISIAFAVAAFVGGGLFMHNTQTANAASSLQFEEELGGGGGCKGAGACRLGGQNYDYAPCNC